MTQARRVTRRSLSRGRRPIKQYRALGAQTKHERTRSKSRRSMSVRRGQLPTKAEVDGMKKYGTWYQFRRHGGWTTRSQSSGGQNFTCPAKISVDLSGPRRQEPAHLKAVATQKYLTDCCGTINYQVNQKRHASMGYNGCSTHIGPGSKYLLSKIYQIESTNTFIGAPFPEKNLQYQYDRIFVKSEDFNFWFKNQEDVPVNFTVHLCRMKSDVSVNSVSGGGLNIQSLVGTGFQELFHPNIPAGNQWAGTPVADVLYNPPNVAAVQFDMPVNYSIRDNINVQKYIKILRTDKLRIPAGNTVEYHLRRDTNKSMDFSYVFGPGLLGASTSHSLAQDNTELYKGEYFLLFEVFGDVAHDTTTTANGGFTNGAVDVMMTATMKYKLYQKRSKPSVVYLREKTLLINPETAVDDSINVQPVVPQ